MQSSNESFFSETLYDSRFTSSDFHSFPSTHAIETDPISFNLPALKSGSVYRINQALLSISVELVQKTNNQKPANGSKVALGNLLSFFFRINHLLIKIHVFSANNSINALFQSSTLSLNGVAINPNSDYHVLRSSMYL